MSEISADHLNILTLAKRAISARDDRRAWRDDMVAAADFHGAACSDVWEELERQVDLLEGNIPVIEHPSRKATREARQMRHEIVAVVQNAVSDALDDLSQFGFSEDT